MLWNKIKSYNSTMNTTGKKHHNVMGNVLRNLRVSSKKAKVERVYVVTKRYSKQRKFLSLLFKE
jgi:hypothetical protein